MYNVHTGGRTLTAAFLGWLRSWPKNTTFVALGTLLSLGACIN